MNVINKHALFLLCMQKRQFCELAWCLRAFSLTRGVGGKYQPYLQDGVWVVELDDGLYQIEGADPSRPIYAKRECADFKAGDFIGCEADCNAPYAWVLWHHIVVVYAFGAKIPFDPAPRSVGAIESIIASRLTDNPKVPGDEDPSRIYVHELLKFSEGVACILSGLTQVFTPGTTRKSLVTDPKIRQKRAELLEKYKDRLHDPATISAIKAELKEMDKAWIKGDDSEDYLIDKKNFDIVRMKTLLMHGEESAFGDGTQVTLIPTSLDEGLNLNNLPDYANSLRMGSFNRGAQTALGGEEVQYLIRVFQNHAIVMKDCGSKLGIRRLVPVDKAKRYIGYYMIVGEKTVRISEENISQLAGKYIQLRSPQTCLTEGAGYCEICMGDMNARFPKSLGTQTSDIGSMMLYIFMKKAHGTALRTVRFDPKTDLT